MNTDSIVNSVYLLTALHLLVLLSIFIASILIIRSIIKSSSTNKMERIIAIGITALFFKNTINQAIVIPIQQLVANLEKLFYILSDIAIDESRVPDFSSGASPITFQYVLSNYPLAQILFAIALCILLYKGILFFENTVSFNPILSSPPTPNATLYNVVITSILAFSLFLVISVFITIPYLNEMRKPTIYTVARLDSNLKMLAKKDTFQLAINRLSLFDRPIAIDSIIATQVGQTDSATSLILEKYKKVYSSFDSYDQAKNSRATSLAGLQAFAKNYKNREEALRREILVKFESSAASLNVDKKSLYENSVYLFSDYISRSSEFFNYTLQEFSSRDGHNEIQRFRTVENLTNFINQVKTDDSLTKAAYTDGFSQSLFPVFELYPQVLVPQREVNMLEYKKDGSEWGFLGLISQYLIKTGSSELVLLMGMLGFGLLGASLLSFEKTDDINFINSFRTQPMIKHFGNVLARGFGAALVVYLATKGGLAIFSAGSNTDANGYILLLTCFVGAVFSEKVWDKIKVSLYGSANSSPS